MIDDGGPAFPSRAPVVDMDPDTQRIETVRSAFDGMSLRDYFAAAALTGICVSDKFIRTTENTNGQALWAYEIADAMLEARKVKP